MTHFLLGIHTTDISQRVINAYKQAKDIRSVGIHHSGARISFGRAGNQISNSEVVNKPSTADREDPLHILKVRLAKGEISKEEYDEIRNVLE